MALRRFLRAHAAFTLEEVSVRGCRLRVRRATATPLHPGPPVVLLAGLGLSGSYLLPVGAELAARLPVWVPNMPGYGGSQAPRRAPDLPELADFVMAWVREAGLEPVALVGNSMGCQVAVEAAARHPEHVSHVVLEGPTMDATARSVLRHVWRVALDAPREPLSLGPLQVADWLRTGPRRLVADVRHAFAHRVEERLPDVACPALVVRGSRDPIVPQRWAEEVAGRLPAGELRVVPGGSHAMTYSKPVVLARLVEGFLLRRPGAMPPGRADPGGAPPRQVGATPGAEQPRPPGDAP